MTYDLKDLRERNQIVEVAEALGLEPRRSGSSFLARCPAHDDKGRPNLVIYPAGTVKCYRCGYHADVIGLVVKVKGLDMGDAIRWLAGRVGMQAQMKPGSRTSRPVKPAALPLAKGAPLPEEQPKTATVEQQQPQAWESVTVTWSPATSMPTIGGKWNRLTDGSVQAIYTADELAIILGFQGFTFTPEQVGAFDRDELAWILSGAAEEDLLPAQVVIHQAPRQSLRVRVYEALLTCCETPGSPSDGAIWLDREKGIAPATQAEFGIAWLKDWEKADRELRATFGDGDLASLGLLAVEKKTGKITGLRFKGHRLIFPFWLTLDGRRYPVYVQGRNIHAQDKRERFNNPSGSVPCLYNFDAIQAARAAGKPVILCEGATDTLTLAQNGYHSVGIVGTQGFKPEWTRHLAGLEILLATDGDQAGREAARKIAQVFVAEGMRAPKAIPIPNGQDVTDYFTGKRTKTPTP